MIEVEPVRSEDLLQAMQAGAVVLTGNARLSRTLRSDYDQAMLASGREAWASPDILPYSAWLKAALEQAGLLGDAVLPRLLNAEQEAALWSSVLARDADTLLRPAATARAVARSWQLMQDYGLDLDDPAFGFGEDSQSFRRWARSFKSALKQRDCVPAANLSRHLAPLFASGELSPPDRIILLGFYELTPAQQTLAAALAEAGAQVRWVTLAGVAADTCRVQARDPLHELQLAAQWSRIALEQRPGKRIGIVVPDLSACRAPLARHLSEALAPALLQPGHGDHSRPWNFSLGEPLSAYPVIETALNLLALTQRELPLETVNALLASPWWAMPEEAGHHAEELTRRALLDARLRKQHGQPQISPRNVKYFASQADEDGAPLPWSVPRLRRVLKRLQLLRDDLYSHAGAADWAHSFSAWLKAAGWCSGSRLDSSAWQAVEKWQELLATLSSLDEFESSLSLGSALALVRRLAAEMVFQPQAPEAPVQVLGLLEANEQTFDGLWVLGLHDGRWPQPSSPDPFIPLSLQRAHGLPGCDPARELERARQITAQLAGSAGQVVFSFPAADGDEKLRASPLIRSLPERAAAEMVGDQRPDWCALISASRQLEPLPLHRPIPFAGGRAHGGSQLFRHQSACPFRAFAEHRLGATPLESASLGLDAAERGSLMHKVLELFWRKTGTSLELHGLPESELEARVAQCVAAAIEDRARQLEWQPQLSGIERQRLADQVLLWLALEKERSPFSVESLEHKAQLNFGDLVIETKIDRIDVLENGHMVIIDYKTGKVTPSAWFGERPDDPQLPLYTSLTLPQPLSGVVFGVVRADEQKFSGVVAENGLLPGLPAKGRSEAAQATETWPAVLDDWSQICRDLADDYCAGHATVDPKKGLQTCQSSYCTLAPLCRIHTALPEDTGGGE